ncbi:TM0106 family RecB-like putative nuclease [Amnibacterium sp. CER49]|uniref:TM0106 family RecB-like putative nuclease n=1 Tax=Amnibacterium sp. CER49 TaxID=3039161 RepID=UPI00244C286D|nr:TM0106 family RecB-like putative nuclease [Amnibacterium sp. CER49]MDH2444519.1 TM0106 family RecB-like putative nuclease [Amnibacterium sp. CER49]
MFVQNGTVVCSASDLKAAVECEWGLMRRLDAKLGRVDAVPEPEDPMNRRAAALGDVHEQRQLEAYLQTFGEWTPGRAGGVASIERPDDSRDFAQLRAAQDRTLAAMTGGADVVFQATLFDGSFLGFADFLVRGGDHWEVFDTKLARRAKVTALLQLAAYARQLQALGVAVGEQVHLLLGDGTSSTHRLQDIEPVFDLRMTRLRRLVDDRLAAHAAIEWGAEGVAADGRCAECTAQVEATRDVLLVGRLTVGQRLRLREVGIRTVDEFAASTGPVPGIGSAALQRLRLQAELQLRAERSETGEHRVRFEIIDAEGLAALPEPSPGDVFFDFEGDPLWSDDGRNWGLEYLFGVIDHDGRREHFRPFWAHDRAQEKRALLHFLTYVRDRRRQYPDLHIYHYADYERSHLQQLCARHGVGEPILDDLLRDHVFVDLYPIVLRTLRISERSYSLKKLEPLYMGGRLRNGDVTNAAASVDAYVEYRALLERGAEAEAEALLGQIADYNEYDCVSTLQLRDWLLARGDELRVRRRPPLPDDEPGRDTQLARREDAARDALLATVSGIPAGDRTPDETALALAAAAIEYHRREDKTYWWEHFNREVAPVEEWAEQKEVLVADSVEVERDWGRQDGDRVDGRVLRIIGSLAPGGSLRVGQRPFLMYDDPAPAGCGPTPAGQRGEHARTTVLAVETLRDGSTAVRIEERVGADDGIPDEPWAALPIAITPPPPIATMAQRQAILEQGEALADSPTRRDAVLDLLRRRPPRLTGDGGLPEAGDDRASAIVRAALRLDESYLAVQGPPGSGKTHLGARVIAELVQRHGWRVGVVAQSHAVVEHLLEGVIAAGVDAGRVAKRPDGKGGTGRWTPVKSNSDVRAFITQRTSDGLVLGGTSWDFSNASKVPRRQLDLLVVDEAGQYSLANTIAVAASARNLLLLGDPQQLPQVSQGLHPEPVDTSALGWLSDGHDVLPPELGYFLAESWRMHPALSAAVSDLSYEGRLTSKKPETTRRHLDGAEPGVHPVPVLHDGDSVSSEAEAEAVVELVRRHVGPPWTDPDCRRRQDPLRPSDVIVVAPFNAQVALIRDRLDAAGYRDVRVGTVDRFQGQEAVLAIVSLTASSPIDVPRGVAFVMNRNRLNVAISRAQWATFLVHSPALADYLPHDAEGVAELSGFLRLTAPEPEPASLR